MPIVLALSLAACTSDFDPGSRVTSLRVLAVRADLPLAHPGEEVHLDTLWFEPQARAITWGWATCTNPDSATVSDCFARAATGTFAVGPQSTFAFTVPEDVIDSLPPPARPHALVGVVTVACPGSILPGTSTFGTDVYPFRCVDAQGRALGLDEMVVGMRRIWVRNTDRNANPGIAQVTWDGLAWGEGDIKEVSSCATTGNDYSACDSSDTHTISVTLADGAVESGVDEYGIPFAEQVVVQYYATEGIFQNDVGVASAPGTGWVARADASGQVLTLWMVVRDDRGGVSWATRQVKVR
jgi:hypothetical protein